MVAGRKPAWTSLMIRIRDVCGVRSRYPNLPSVILSDSKESRHFLASRKKKCRDSLLALRMTGRSRCGPADNARYISHVNRIGRRQGHVRALAALTAASALLVGLPNLESQGSAPTEYEVKAAYLYNFGRFVEWPPTAPSANANSFQLCVLGKDPFGPALYKTIAGESIGGKYVVAKQVSSPQDAGDCREVFISASEDGQLAAILPALDEARTLTVSDMPQFVQRGGMIEFVSQSNRIRFQVNLTAAQHAGLTLSSQLLKVATKVIRTDASEK